MSRRVRSLSLGLALGALVAAGAVRAQPPLGPEALAAEVRAARGEQARQGARLEGVRTALKDQLLRAQQDIASLRRELEEQARGLDRLRREREALVTGGGAALVLALLLALAALAAAVRTGAPGLAGALGGLRRRRRSLLADLAAQEERARALRRALEEERASEG